MNSYYILILINSIGLLVSFNQLAIAGINSKVDLNILENNRITNISTCNAISEEDFPSSIKGKSILKAEKQPSPINRKKNHADIPPASIWWAAEQFDPFGGGLIQNWLTYPQKQQINLTVDWQLWTNLDYLGRYRFVNQFGTVVRKHGYSLNVLSQKEQCLATYKYNSDSKPPKWELHLEKLGKDSLEAES